MKNRIEILCPSRHCPKCRKMISFLENNIVKYQRDAELIIVTNLKDFLRFNIWILPSIFINGNKVSRGYTPNIKDIINNLI